MEPGDIHSYHAHIYYDPATTRDRAARLRGLIDERFAVQIGNWHDEAVGPHPVSMYQVVFAVEDFPRFVPWLMLQRDGLTVLVHPNTHRPRDDHMIYPLWLGAVLPLVGEAVPEAMDRPHDPLLPNTQFARVRPAATRGKT